MYRSTVYLYHVLPVLLRYLDSRLAPDVAGERQVRCGILSDALEQGVRCEGSGSTKLSNQSIAAGISREQSESS